MGSAVSGAVGSLTGSVGNIVGGGGSFSDLGNIASGGLGGAAGGAGQDIANIVKSIVPDIPIADQTALQNQINQQQGMANQNQNQAQSFLGQGANTLANNQANINQAQQFAQGGNVANSLALLQGQANGTAPSAAQAQLQSGKDQAIATQHALANSGNLSQMIGGQRGAMTNAANLTQQAANQATQLRANQQIAGQQNYAQAAANQAGQVAQNAGLQTTLGSAQNATGLGLANVATSGQANALGGQQGALGIEQQALGQTGQNRAIATGGLLNAGGSALGLASDEDLKTDVKSESPFAAYDKPDDRPKYNHDENDDTPSSKEKAEKIKQSFKTRESTTDHDYTVSDEDAKKDIKKPTMLEKFLDNIDPVSFKYKDPDGEMGKTPGTHLGVIAQQVEKAPGGESMVHDTEKGKMIDIPSAVGMLMAAAADGHDRMKELEMLFKQKRSK
jgi:hypothetical protein